MSKNIDFEDAIGDGDVPSPAWRLRGEIAGEIRVYALELGENGIGSSRSGSITLGVSGISRQHALLIVDAEKVLLRDLGSKNGTFVDDRPIEGDTELRDGDTLGFGPARLKLEAVDPDDAFLAMRVDADPGPSVAGDEAESWLATGLSQATPLLGRTAEQIMGRAVEVAEEFSARLLAGHDAALPEAILALCRGLGASGVCVLEWSSEGRASVVATVGELGDPPPYPVLSVAAGHLEARHFSLEDGPPPFAFGALRGYGRPMLGLVARGAFPGRTHSAPLLLLCLRLIAHLRARSHGTQSLGFEDEAGAGPSAEREGPRRLRFPEGIVRGESVAMQSLYREMEALLQGDLSVLILGETGVGKEHLARALHDSSNRGHAPFVPINCAALPSELLEAELFGIGRGVATGVQARRGRFSEADGGTLFLDEIGDMPAPLQAKVLRTLQDGRVWPLGSQPRDVDVRVIAATNTDLRQRMDSGQFRADLYFRLAGYVLRVPGLRHRPDDIPPLVACFLRRFSEETGKSIAGVTLKALRRLQAHAWPGNVRELEHVLRRAVYLCPRGQAIDSTLLSAEILEEAPAATEETDDLVLAPRLEALERRLIRRALVRTAGNQRAAARLLEVSRNGLAKRLERLGIDAKEFVP